MKKNVDAKFYKH